MKYDIKLDTTTDALIRTDSRAAEKFVGPYLGPTAMQTLRILYGLSFENTGGVEVSRDELVGRLGLNERKVDPALNRLAKLGVITMTAGDDEEMCAIAVPDYVNPPRATWRSEHYPATLYKEFVQFVKNAERTLAASPGPDVEGVAI